jgi:hypothetical protein
MATFATKPRSAALLQNSYFTSTYATRLRLLQHAPFSAFLPAVAEQEQLSTYFKFKKNGGETEMKLCIELNKEMEEMWNDVREELEHELQYVYRVSVTLPDNLVLLGLLDGFANELVSM